MNRIQPVCFSCWRLLYFCVNIKTVSPYTWCKETWVSEISVKLYFLCWFFQQSWRYSIHSARRQETQNDSLITIKAMIMFPSPLHFLSLAAHTTTHMWESSFIARLNMNTNVVISQFILDLNWFLQFQVNDNGLLTFNQPSLEAQPSSFPTYGAEDYIAPLWTDLNDFGMGVYSYQQYTNGSVLTRATRDINQYFPQRAFTASWVFVTTWDFVQTRNTSVFNHHSAPVNHFLITRWKAVYRPSIIRFSFFLFFQAITFQVVLISGGGFSFILMNYGDCVAISFPVEVKQISQDRNSFVNGLRVYW